MSSSSIRLPADWRRFDRAGLIGSLIFPALLTLLWLTGFGPSAYLTCEAPSKPLVMSIASGGGKVALTGRVGRLADRNALIEAARSVYGADNVTDKLEVDSAVGPLASAANIGSIVKRLKSIDQAVTVKIDGPDALLEGQVADKATRDGTATEVAGLLGDKVKLRDALTVRPAPPAPPKKEPAPAPKAAETAPAPIAAGTLGRYRLPDGSEISIMGNGLETRLLAFLNDGARQVDRGLWFDFDRLQFATGSSSLTPESRAQIETVVAILKAYPNTAIKIGGYTDNVGDPAANLKLSASRAERVANELIGQGIATDRVEWEGYGEQHPIADNATAEGRAANRRTAMSVRRK